MLQLKAARTLSIFSIHLLCCLLNVNSSMNLQMKGVRVVWGKDGLIKREADNREKQGLGPEISSPATPDDFLNVLVSF